MWPRVFIISGAMFATFLAGSQTNDFNTFYTSWIKDYVNLHIPDTELDYKVNFGNIPTLEELLKQEKFFNSGKLKLRRFNPAQLTTEELIRLKHLQFETEQNLHRIALEKKWNRGNRIPPPAGLYSMPNHKDWYRYYVKHFTGLNISAEEVFKLGEDEVAKSHKALFGINRELAYERLQQPSQDSGRSALFINDKNLIIRGFGRIDSTVRKNLDCCFNDYRIPKVEAMEWPDAGALTPPGIYLSKDNNPYQVDVFQFNFHSGRYNRHCMEWLYLHEAVPGHHLQHIFSSAGEAFFYFGTCEGWACYVEELGESLGLYKERYSQLGKEEWNLVRSARLVMEVGIHYYGWTYEKAMQYWKDNITGQDEIANREITRITNWPGQALCYKVGALAIQKIILARQKKGASLKDCHDFILKHSDFPLEALLAVTN